MTLSCFKRTLRGTVAGLAILAAFPALFFAQQPQAMCRASLETYVLDKSLNAHWEGDTVVMKSGGVEYVCRCVSETQPPECKPRNSSGASGLSGVDISRFKPGQQLALMATQSLLQGLFSNIFGADKPAGAAEDALERQQAMLREQEEAREQALNDWNIFQIQEKKRLQAEQDEAKTIGQALFDKMGGAGGQGLGFQSVSGEKLEFNEWAARKPEASPLPSGKYPAPKTAVEQARCAAYFSERASELSKLGKNEEAQFMNLQSQKAMTGETLDVPCQAAAAVAGADSGTDPQKAGSQAMAMGINEILNQYNAKIQELLEISQKLGQVRKQKLAAEFDVREMDARIMDIKSQAAAATQPEEKQKCDDLLNEALALRGQSENLLKVAADNEKAFVTDARKAESQVQELSSKLQEGKDKK
jgi:hypothetical protein